MSWLTPLGFLGLIGLVVLIIIYIIRPNFQNKIISSTFIWRLSLRYKKKKMPLSKLRNILLFICQVLIISIAAAILAQPIIEAESEDKYNEKVVIIDASASMLTTTGYDTRFERAVDAVRTLSKEVLDADGKMSIILAHDTASFLIREAGADKSALINDELDKLVDASYGNACTYGASDISGAIKLAEEITSVSSDVEVLLYTDTNYVDHGKVKLVPMADPSDWNAAILDVRAVLDEGYYRIEIDVACYGGVDADIDISCDVSGVNSDKSEVELSASARCKNGEVTTLIFSPADNDVFDDDTRIYSYESITVRTGEYDSFAEDNIFYLYGGEKRPLKIQYSSPLKNNFFDGALLQIRDILGKRWDVEYDDVYYNPEDERTEDPALEGYDVYIFEHYIPPTLPNDGFIFLVHPDKVPATAGLRLGNVIPGDYNIYTNPVALTKGDPHPVLDMVNVEKIELTQYTAISSYDGYTPLMYCGNDPVFMVKNEPEQKIAVMSFNIHLTNLAMLPEFPLLMYNMIEHFVPATITDFVYEINDTVDLNSRSDMITLAGPAGSGVDGEVTEFPTTVVPTVPGVYTVTQTPLSGDEITDSFYVKIPDAESNINAEVDVLVNPYFMQKQEVEDQDLLLYFAIALVALLFAEWWLQTREQF
ncbi:MAG: VWA domain-containing protein [Clostridia bacterium]|nr:VWA domain-containing protein [Clostridia bacterium]